MNDRNPEKMNILELANEVDDLMDEANFIDLLPSHYLLTLEEINARLRATDWRSIDDGNLKPYVAYLTKHKDDLFPIVAALLPGVNGEPDYWARQIEGPEDDNHSPGWNGPLYRAPTHYLTLDALPPPPKT